MTLVSPKLGHLQAGGSLERKELRFHTHPARLKSFPFYSCLPSRSDRRLEEGGAGRRGKSRHCTASRERKGNIEATWVWSNTGELAARGA